jgi:Flp pilus assembly protein TadG
MPAVLSVLRVLARADDGGALQELAISVGVFASLLIGLTELGRFAYYSILVANAASAGVQYGAQTLETANDTAGMATAAKNDGGSTVSATGTNYCVCYSSGTETNKTEPCTTPPSCTSPAHVVYYVQITASGSYTSLFHYPGVPTSITVSRVAVMRVTQTL